ncbi:SbmA/BacA-like family transporter [Escherichia coli]
MLHKHLVLHRYYNLIQTALSSRIKSLSNNLPRSRHLCGDALIAVVISVLNNFFVSHYVFRSRRR